MKVGGQSWPLPNDLINDSVQLVYLYYSWVHYVGQIWTPYLSTDSPVH